MKSYLKAMGMTNLGSSGFEANYLQISHCQSIPFTLTHIVDHRQNTLRNSHMLRVGEPKVLVLAQDGVNLLRDGDVSRSVTLSKLAL